MYFMLECLSPFEGHQALINYEPDDLWRNWKKGQKFKEPPTEPVIATIGVEEGGVMMELFKVPLPLMTKKLASCLLDAGVANIDYYQSEIDDASSSTIHKNYFAFNIIGAIAAADLEKSKFSSPDGPMISVDFDSLSINPTKTRNALIFRLAESVNGIVIHESVKNAIEAAGIDTLTFIPPEEWVG